MLSKSLDECDIREVNLYWTATNIR